MALLGVTGGEEDGVDNTDVDSSRLYTQPEEVAYAYEELMKVKATKDLTKWGDVAGPPPPSHCVKKD